MVILTSDSKASLGGRMANRIEMTDLCIVKFNMEDEIFVIPMKMKTWHILGKSSKGVGGVKSRLVERLRCKKEKVNNGELSLMNGTVRIFFKTFLKWDGEKILRWNGREFPLLCDRCEWIITGEDDYELEMTSECDACGMPQLEPVLITW